MYLTKENAPLLFTYTIYLAMYLSFRGFPVDASGMIRSSSVIRFSFRIADILFEKFIRNRSGVRKGKGWRPGTGTTLKHLSTKVYKWVPGN